MDQSQKEQSLSLKVMRLTKPSFRLALPVLCEGDDLASSVLLQGKHAQSEYFGLSNFLSLPHNFGNIYLGETFSSYICINNTSPHDVYSVAVKAELQTTTQRFSLLDVSATQISQFRKGESRDFIVKHEVKEEGIHILVCSAHYTRHDGETKFFRKFFKFIVEKPFEVKTKSHAVDEAYFVQVTLQNNCKQPILLGDVSFNPLPPFQSAGITLLPASSFSPVHKLNTLNAAAAVSSLEAQLGLPPTMCPSSVIFLKPSCTWQFLFKIEPETLHLPKEADKLGHISITWKTSLGEAGCYHTDPIPRIVQAPQEVELRLFEVPAHISLEEPFTISCRVTNQSARALTLRLELMFQKMAGIACNGSSAKDLGVVQPGASCTTKLNLFATQPGIQAITGLRVVSVDGAARSVDFDNIKTIFVQSV